MRRYLLAACVLIVPVVVHGEMRCAVPVTPEPENHAPKPLNVNSVVVPLLPRMNPASDTQFPAAVVNPMRKKEETNLSVIPVLAHVAGAGAQLTDLGFAHGMRMVLARNGDQFMIFETAPDGNAVVSGLMMDASVDQLRTIGGKDVIELSAAHGLRALFLRNGSRFQVFYATPDGQRVIPGVLWDANGKDLTRDQLASVPGAIPTVTIGGDTGRAAAVEPPSLMRLAEAASYGAVGNRDAPVLWMFIDPQCSVSVRAMQQLQPYVASGRIHLNVIPLSLLDYEDGGLSTRSAIRLIEAPSGQMVQAWESGSRPDGSSADGERRLRGNMDVAAAIGLRGTPTFLWRKADGTEGRLDGLPDNFSALIASMGR
jgi:thiol:disulfide interchange protein DsbG